MTLRFDAHGRPIGLDWTVCNDGKNDTSVWTGVRDSPNHKPKSKRRDILNPGSGRGSNMRLPYETEERLLKMYKEGIRPLDIAEELGIAYGTIFKIVRRNGLSTITKIRQRRKSQFADAV